MLGITLLALSSCSADHSVPSMGTDPNEQTAYRVQLAAIIESAGDGQTSRAQIDLLASSEDDGYLSYDTAHAAFTNYANCLSDHGMEVEERSPSGPPELPRFQYVVSVFPGTSDESWEEYCYTSEFEKVDLLYQLQPRAQRARKDLLESHRDELLSCLNAAGLTLPADATIDEIRREVWFALDGRYPDSDPSVGPPTDFESTDCLSPSGLSIEDMNE